MKSRCRAGTARPGRGGARTVRAAAAAQEADAEAEGSPAVEAPLLGTAPPDAAEAAVDLDLGPPST